MTPIKFFRQRHMKEREITEVCTGLEYLRMPKDSTVIRYGEEGDKFYIIMKGSVAIWLPFVNADMKRPLEAFKK